MYNRYMPREGFEPMGPPENRSGPAGGGLLSGLFSGTGTGGSTGFLKKLLPEHMDKGDILLILVLIYLYADSEDEEWLIILGLVVLMGL